MNELLNARLSICKKCPLYKDSPFGAMCDSSKYMNSEGDVLYIPKEGYTRGCNCLLRKKAANAANHCVCKKW